MNLEKLIFVVLPIAKQFLLFKTSDLTGYVHRINDKDIQKESVWL